MADTKISALPAIAALAAEDPYAVVDDPAGTPATTKATHTQANTLFDSLAHAFSAAVNISSTFEIAGGDGNFDFIVTRPNIAADRILNLPLLTGTDTLVCEAFAATLTNKTIDGDNNTITNLAIGAEVTGASTDLTDTANIPYKDGINTFTGLNVFEQSILSPLNTRRISTDTNTQLAAGTFIHKTTDDMVDPFGVMIHLGVEDSTPSEQILGSVGVRRDGGDTSGLIVLQATALSTLTDVLTIDSAGLVDWTQGGAHTNFVMALGGTGNTVTGTAAEFDTACTDDDFAYLGAANTFTAQNIFDTASAESAIVKITTSTTTSDVSPLRVMTDLSTPNEFGVGFRTGITLAAKDTAATVREWVRLQAGTPSTDNKGEFIIQVLNSGVLTDSFSLKATGLVDWPQAGAHTNFVIDANGTGNAITNIDVADLADGTDGELITWDAAGAPAVVAAGTATHVLTSNGAGTAPTFQANPAGFTDPMTTRGDLIYKDSGGTTTRLAAGSNTFVLTSDGTDISWSGRIASIDGDSVATHSLVETANRTNITSPGGGVHTFDISTSYVGQATITTLGTVTTGDVDAVVSASSTTTAGKVELATTAEIDTGTDSTRAIPVDQFVASDRNVRFINIRLIDATTSVAADTDVGGDFRLPFDCTILQSDSTPHYLSADTDTAGITGTMVVDIHLNGTTIMTTNKLDIETTEESSVTAATQPDLTTTAYTAGDILTFDIDSIHSGTAALGLTIKMAVRMT